MKTQLTLEEMHRLVSSNGTGWVWERPGIGHITTWEGWWTWSDDLDCYVLTHPTPQTKEPACTP